MRGPGRFDRFAERISNFTSVALLQNSQRHAEAAIQAKLDALADGLADLMEHHLDHDDVDLKSDVEDLEQAVGLEQVDSG